MKRTQNSTFFHKINLSITIPDFGDYTYLHAVKKYFDVESFENLKSGKLQIVYANIRV